MNSVTISKNKIRKEGGVVVLPIEEYERLTKRAVPEYYLAGKAAENLDKLVKEGMRDYELGKCKKLKSLADLD